jgi:hypothetical protein
MGASGGTNDTKILLVILAFLFMVSFALTIIRPALRVGEALSNVPNISQIGDTARTNPSFSLTDFGMIWNLLIGIFIYFPGFPFWFNLLFILLRVILVWLIIKVLARGTGG